MLKNMARCGSCTQCCFFTAVPELGKGNHFWCAFCTPGEGCKSYSLRPLSCSEYVCLYYVNYWLPEKYRPDQCGVMFEKLYDSKTFLAMVDPERPNSWQVGLGRKVIVKLREDGFSIVVHNGIKNQKHIILADGDTKDNVLSGIRHAIQTSDARIGEMHGSSIVCH